MNPIWFLAARVLNYLKLILEVVHIFKIQMPITGKKRYTEQQKEIRLGLTTAGSP